MIIFERAHLNSQTPAKHRSIQDRVLGLFDLQSAISGTRPHGQSRRVSGNGRVTTRAQQHRVSAFLCYLLLDKNVQGSAVPRRAPHDAVEPVSLRASVRTPGSTFRCHQRRGHRKVWPYSTSNMPFLPIASSCLGRASQRCLTHRRCPNVKPKLWK